MVPKAGDGVPTFKFIIVGDASVGKSSIISRFHKSTFNSGQDATIGATFCNHMLNVASTEAKLQIWDTSGQELYRSITRSYYRDSSCAIVVCDLTKPATFDSITDWIKDIKRLGPENCKIIIVGNKVDLERKVSEDDLRELSERMDCPFFETSAMTGEHIREVFEDAALMCFADAGEQPLWVKASRVAGSEPADVGDKDSCC
jgi:small GTP-binding protein